MPTRRDTRALARYFERPRQKGSPGSHHRARREGTTELRTPPELAHQPDVARGLEAMFAAMAGASPAVDAWCV